MSLHDTDQILNVICAPHLTRSVLAANLYPRGRFLTAPAVVDLVCGSLDDRAILTYAQSEGKDFAAAQALCRAAHFTARDLGPQRPDYPPLKKVEDCRARLKELGFLKADDLNLYSMSCYHSVIIGYDPASDGELFDALAALRLTEGAGAGQYEVHGAEEILGVSLLDSSRKLTVHVFENARNEVIFGLSHVCGLLKTLGQQELTSRDITICCPPDYNGLLSQCESMFGLQLSLPLSVPCDLPCFRDFIGDVHASQLTDEQALGAYQERLEELAAFGPGFKRTVTTLMDALSLARSVQEQTPLTDELLQQYLRAKIISRIDLETEQAQRGQPIRVVNSFHSVVMAPARHLVFLGFNSTLIPSSVDSNIIPDALKRQCGYARTSVQNNAATIQQVRFALASCDSVYLSRATNSTSNSYSPVFFVATSPEWIEERNERILENPTEPEMADWEASNPTYTSRQISLPDGTCMRPDLEVFSSFGQDLYRRTLSYQPFTDAIVRTAPEAAAAFNSYNPMFSCDRETVDYLTEKYSVPAELVKDARGGYLTAINLSFTALELYTQNPFNFYCQKVLEINGGDSLASLQGTYLHAAMERGDQFDPIAAKDKLLEDINFPLGGMGREEVSFFIDRAYENYLRGIREPLSALMSEMGLKYIDPAEGDEFEARKILLDNGASFTLKADAIYTTSRAEGAIIVDFKKNADISKKVNLNEALVGNLLQLPLYCLFFEKLCLQEKNRAQLEGLKDKLLGAYIVTLQRKWKEPKQIIMGGLTVKDWVPDGVENFKGMYISPDKLQSDANFTTLEKRFNMLLSDPSSEVYRPFASEQDIIARFTDDNPGFIASIKSAILVINQVLFYLRHGRLISKGEVEAPIWFPDYPLVEGNANKPVPVSFSSYPDISFLEKDDQPRRNVKSDTLGGDWHLSFGDASRYLDEVLNASKADDDSSDEDA